jgi:cobalt-precorrin 5A hydrolase / precorrin-3B C17-methyltransferase
VALCASGILIRILAPLLADKFAEPPVIAVAEDGSAAVPLLGGHRGANALARRIAELTGAVAAVTTASDLRLGVALDEPPPGYVLANPEHVKAFAARLIAGEPVRLRGAAPWLAGLEQSETARLSIAMTTRDIPGSPDHLVYHPRCLASAWDASAGRSPTN